MCGRFVTYIPLEEILKIFEIDINLVESYNPSYNISPSNEVLTIYKNKNKKILNKFRWGLVPFWAEDTSIGYKMINARVESLSKKKTFKPLINSKRCGIISNGFYEWRKEGNQKVPYYIKLKNDKPFAFAGLYDSWEDSEGNEMNSCTIITTSANEKVSQIHDRMPVILEKENLYKWINKEYKFESTKNILIPKKSTEVEIYQVGKQVNSPKNNTETNIIPHKENKLF